MLLPALALNLTVACLPPCLQGLEKLELTDKVRGDVITELLPIVDNFELARTQVWYCCYCLACVYFTSCPLRGLHGLYCMGCSRCLHCATCAACTVLHVQWGAASSCSCGYACVRRSSQRQRVSRRSTAHTRWAQQLPPWGKGEGGEHAHVSSTCVCVFVCARVRECSCHTGGVGG